MPCARHPRGGVKCAACMRSSDGPDLTGALASVARSEFRGEIVSHCYSGAEIRDMQVKLGLIPAPTPSVIRVGNTASTQDNETYTWTVYVDSKDVKCISAVTFELHETFNPNRVTVDKAPFRFTASGWGTFTIPITMTTTDGRLIRKEHQLSFDAPDTHTEYVI